MKRSARSETQTSGRKVRQVGRVRKWRERACFELKQRKKSPTPQYPSRLLKEVVAFRAPGSIRHRGFLIAGETVIRCSIGRNGLSYRKREGDGCSPAGLFRLTAVLWRNARSIRPVTGAPVTNLRPDQIWCDDPSSRLYNRPGHLPCQASHERLWRSDRLYDVIGVLDYNIQPRIRGAGSAIFFHLADEKYGPTAGCVAISEADMRRLLPRLGKGVRLAIQ